MITPEIKIALPSWTESLVDWKKRYKTDEEKMSLTINLSAENVSRKTGGPFGAAIFSAETGELSAVGVNQVVRLNNSTLHAEMVAIMTAQAVLENYSLNSSDYELFASCEPCCMCLGATLWSGVRRLVCAATKDDAFQIGFDEGPVYESSYKYLEDRGIAVRRNFMREEATKVFDSYVESGGVIYNG